MIRLIGCILLVFVSTTIVGQTKENDSKYGSWCLRVATAENVAAPEKDGYIRRCAESLEAADSSPDQVSKQDRKRSGKDDG